jgi:osomolarity two-component system sensor histidine kinase NIK1
VARGDLTQKITGVRVSGEILQLVTTINSMIDDLDSFARGVMRVAKEVGTDGKLGGQANTDKLKGTWLDITYAHRAPSRADILGRCGLNNHHCFTDHP